MDGEFRIIEPHRPPATFGNWHKDYKDKARKDKTLMRHNARLSCVGIRRLRMAVFRFAKGLGR
jgi:hypothetical protein